MKTFESVAIIDERVCQPRPWLIVIPVCCICCAAPTNVLNEIGLKVLFGSSQMARDIRYAEELFKGALKRATTIPDIQQALYFWSQGKMTFIRQQLLRKEMSRGHFTPEQSKAIEVMAQTSQNQINRLVRERHPQASFTLAKQIFVDLKRGVFDDSKSKVQRREKIRECREYLEFAAEHEVIPAYFYLAKFCLDGEFEPVNTDKAMDYLNLGADKNDAFCLYELSQLFGQGQHVAKD